LNWTRFIKVFLLQADARKAEILMWSWSTAVGCMISGHGFPPIFPSIFTVFSIFAFATSVYTYNDITDIKLDSLNPIKKKRPIASGKITMNEAKTIVFIFGVLGFILALLVPLKASILIMIWAVLFYLYSNPKIRLKRRFLLKEGTIGLGFFLSTIIGAVSVGSITPTIIFAGIFFGAFVFLGFPAFRDTLDIKEDKLYGVKSLAVLLDWKKKVEMVILFVLAVMTLTPLTYIHLNLNVIFPIVTVALCFLVLRHLLPLLKRFDERKYKRAYNSLFGLFVASQVFMILGTMPIRI